MLKIPQEKNPNQKEQNQQENQERKSNLDIHEAVGKEASKPVASEVSSPLDDLDQFYNGNSSEEGMNSQQSGSEDNSNPFEAPSPRPKNNQNDNTGDYFGSSQSGNHYEDNNYSNQSYSQPTVSTDMVQQITESIVEEKWEELMDKVGDLRLWKEKINSDITSLKQELLRTQNRFENLQKAILGKVHDYNENIININHEMKALERVFEKILDPLTTNVKELSKITDKLKKK